MSFSKIENVLMLVRISNELLLTGTRRQKVEEANYREKKGSKLWKWVFPSSPYRSFFFYHVFVILRTLCTKLIHIHTCICHPTLWLRIAVTAHVVHIRSSNNIKLILIIKQLAWSFLFSIFWVIVTHITFLVFSLFVALLNYHFYYTYNFHACTLMFDSTPKV